MAISGRLRFEILRRDGHTCRYCGASAPDVHLAVDHVIPIALGGSDDPTNLVTACVDCNAGKASTSPDETTVKEVDADAERWAAAVRLASAIRVAELADDRDLVTGFDATWTHWSAAGRAVPRSQNWPQTVRNYISAGLSDTDLEDYVQTAMTSGVPLDRVWRYFCGVCKNELGRRHELARSLLDAGAIQPAHTTWHADPRCATCGGDGFQSVNEPGRPATFAPCHCRRNASDT